MKKAGIADSAWLQGYHKTWSVKPGPLKQLSTMAYLDRRFQAASYLLKAQRFVCLPLQ